MNKMKDMQENHLIEIKFAKKREIPSKHGLKPSE
jgi:hypothetical protein